MSVTEGQVQRRLAAILCADVVGYSRLMGLDEAGTLAALKAHRKAEIDPAFARYNGRIVKLMGDGILVEFPSVVEAVQCAIDVQRAITQRNRKIPADRQITYRVGINVGDIIIEDDDIYGDGVNVAARLQTLADPGGICLSRSARDQIRDKMDIVLDDLGEREVKNIARPQRVFRIVMEDAAPASPNVDDVQEEHDLQGPTGPQKRPSIAVLPLNNMSSDPEQEFFADGLTEDLITELSRFRNLTVIARNSTFTYKGQAVNVPDVARELQVQYVLEGSVRRAGNRIRVTVQLIDGTSGDHVWAERYDRDYDDIFELQDDITRTIVATLPGRVEAKEVIRPNRPSNLAAYDFVARGKILHHRGTREDNAAALTALDKAIDLDPDYAHAFAWKACVLGQAWSRGFRGEEDGVLEEAVENLERAYAIDENDPECHRILSAISLMRGEHEKAEFHQQRGLTLNPNYDLLVVQQGELLTWLGRGDEGAVWIERAMRLNPYHPERFWSHLGRALFVAGRYGEAIEAFRRLATPDLMQKAYLAACYAETGDTAAAQRYVEDVLADQPDFSSAAHVAAMPYREDEDRASHSASLQKAGFAA